MTSLGIVQLDATSWGISHLRYMYVFFCVAKKWGGWDIGFFWHSQKNGADEGGWWALHKAEAWKLWCGSRRYRVPSPPGACFMQIPASELLLFFFFPQKGQIPAGFGEAVKPACL